MLTNNPKSFLREYVRLSLVAIRSAIILLFSCAALSPVWAEQFNVTDQFVPSGWMGDGEYGDKFLSLESASSEDNSKVPLALQMLYRKGGPQKWAGIYWQNKANNWGDRPGDDLSSFQCLSLRAKGKSGGEVVEFKAGGIEAIDRDFHDSFEVSTGRVRLLDEWQTFVVDVSNADLSSVIGGFAVILTVQSGFDEIGVVFDDVIYTDDCGM